MYQDRIPFYRDLERLRASKILVYVTGDRPKMETQIHSEVVHFFADHLDTFNSVDKISLFIYSRGGDTLAGWSIVNMIRQFCERFEVLIIVSVYFCLFGSWIPSATIVSLFFTKYSQILRPTQLLARSITFIRAVFSLSGGIYMTHHRKSD